LRIHEAGKQSQPDVYNIALNNLPIRNAVVSVVQDDSFFIHITFELSGDKNSEAV